MSQKGDANNIDIRVVGVTYCMDMDGTGQDGEQTFLLV